MRSAGLDGAGIRAWLWAAADLLEAHRAELDERNVFPVADADTGTNVLATLRAGLAADLGADGAGEVFYCVLGGLEENARGNSGMLLTEVLRGIVYETSIDRLDADGLREGLRNGARRAREAVGRPVEGTILSVADGASAAAELEAWENDAQIEGDLPAMARAAAAGAAAALARTPSQLPALAAAGVVDSGGQALVLVLDALVSTLTGEPRLCALDVAESPHSTTSTAHMRAQTARMRPPVQRYEVQYLVAAGEVTGLRYALDRLGDSLVVAELEPGRWSVHVHVADVGAAIEAGLAAGTLRGIRVEALPGDPLPAGRAGSVVVAAGLGGAVEALLVEAGVVAGDGAEPAAAAAVVLAPAGDPAGADAADRLRRAGLEVAVVPVRSPVQAVAAAAVHEPTTPLAEIAVTMAEAAAATRWAEVTVATGDAQTSVGRCRVGDVLGLADGDVVLIGTDERAVACELLDRMLSASGELVTLLVAPGCPAVAAVTGHLAAHHRTVEVVVHAGDPAREWVGPPILIGVE